MWSNPLVYILLMEKSSWLTLDFINTWKIIVIVYLWIVSVAQDHGWNGWKENFRRTAGSVCFLVFSSVCHTPCFFTGFSLFCIHIDLFHVYLKNQHHLVSVCVCFVNICIVLWCVCNFVCTLLSDSCMYRHKPDFQVYLIMAVKTHKNINF